MLQAVSNRKSFFLGKTSLSFTTKFHKITQVHKESKSQKNGLIHNLLKLKLIYIYFPMRIQELLNNPLDIHVHNFLAIT